MRRVPRAWVSPPLTPPPSLACLPRFLCMAPRAFFRAVVFGDVHVRVLFRLIVTGWASCAFLWLNALFDYILSLCGFPRALAR